MTYPCCSRLSQIVANEQNEKRKPLRKKLRALEALATSRSIQRKVQEKLGSLASSPSTFFDRAFVFSPGAGFLIGGRGAPVLELKRMRHWSRSFGLVGYNTILSWTVLRCYYYSNS